MFAAWPRSRAGKEAMFVIRCEHYRTTDKVLAELTGEFYQALVEKSFERHASAHWQGSLQEGTGTIMSQSGVLRETQFSFRTRFDHGIGTNPDELIAAALGGCFSMALSNELGQLGLFAEKIDTIATSTLESRPRGWTMTRIQLEVRAKVPKATQSNFMAAAIAAKANCPIARLLNTTISMTASLDNERSWKNGKKENDLP